MKNRWRYLVAFVATISPVFPAAAQLPKAGDMDPTGRVLTKVIVTMTEPRAFGHPISDVNFLVVMSDGDRVSVRTDDAGVANIWLKPGTYRIVNPDPAPWEGKGYTWDIVVTIKGGTGLVRLSQSNATKVVDLVPRTEATSPSSTTAPRAQREAAVRPAQEPTASTVFGKGFHLDFALNGSAIVIDDEDVGEGDSEDGGGLTFALGYAFTPKWGALFSVSVAAISSVDGDYTLGHADLTARYSFAAPGKTFVPYLEAGLTGIAAGSGDEDVELSGGGVTGAAGFNYFFNRHVALDLNLRYTWGELDTVRFGNTTISNGDGIGVRSTRLNIGVAIFP
jgi:hypothetical protein